MRSLYFFISMLLILSGCAALGTIVSPDEPTESFPIDGIWMLEELDDKIIEERELKRGAMLDFKTTTKKISGRTGCNDFGAAFVTNENKIEIEMGAMTRAACPGDLEGRFLKAIHAVKEFKIVNRSLYLMEGSNVKMIFRRPD
jgi:heat shock protein HslJ